MTTPHNNYGGLPPEFSAYEKAKIVILPVPYDGTSTWIKGADKGPEALLKASQNMELYDIETKSVVAEQGIHTLQPLKAAKDPQTMVNEIEATANKLLKDNKFVVMLGGEHSITTGLAKAYKKKYSNMSVLQLDAHGDTRESFEGSPYNHACIMARVREFCPIVQVGIRSIDEEETKKMDMQRVFFAHEIHNNEKWMQRAIDLLTENVLITIDLDVFDPGIMPSTGTPEPGGLGWYQVTTFLQKVITQKNVVGFDVVELCPNSANKAPDFLAAKLVYRILSMIYAKKE